MPRRYSCLLPFLHLEAFRVTLSFRFLLRVLFLWRIAADYSQAGARGTTASSPAFLWKLLALLDGFWISPETCLFLENSLIAPVT